MTLLLTIALQHGGDGRIDLIYFWSSILIVTLPLGVFAFMTYRLVKAYRKRVDSAHEPPRPNSGR